MSAAFVTTDLDRALAKLDTPTLWQRFTRAVARSRLDRTEREVARFLEQNGGRLTDDIERRILERVSGLERSGFC
jgi:hypothetical protein